MNEESRGPSNQYNGPIIRSHPESKLLAQHILDDPDGTDKFMSENFRFYLQKIGTASEKEAMDILFNIDKHEFERMHYGIIYGILTEPQNAQKYFTHLVTIASARGGKEQPWHMAIYATTLVLVELFHKMLKHVRYQFFFLFRETIKLDVNGFDACMMEFMRGLNDVHAAEERYKLYESLFAILEANKPYIAQLKPTSSRGHNHFVSHLTYTCAHLVCDLTLNGPYERLRVKSTDLLLWLIKNRLHDVVMIGRDFILVLIRGTKIKEIEEIFDDLLNNPTRFEPFNGFDDIRSRPPCLTGNRISASLDKKMQFLLKAQRLGLERMEWFWKLIEEDYIRPHGDDNGWIKGEIVRYLLHHQSTGPNEPIQPMPFEAKTHLLTLIFLQAKPDSVELQYLKLCLWFDWLMFVPPPQGKLPQQMFNSLQLSWNFVRNCLNTSQLQIITLGNACLQFLIKASELMCPRLASRFQESCTSALTILRECQGSNFISQVLDNARVERSYRTQLREYFKDFVRQPPQGQQISTNNQHPTAKDVRPEQTLQTNQITTSTAKTIEDMDDTTELPKEKEISAEAKEYEKRQETNRNLLEADLSSTKESRMQQLSEIVDLMVSDIRPSILKLRDVFNDPSTNDMKRSEEVQELIMNILRTENVMSESEQLEFIGQAIHLIFGPLVTWVDSVLPESPTVDSLEECFNAPIYVFFRNVVRRTHDDPAHRNAIIQLIAAWRDNNSAVGYLLIFFLKYEALSKDSGDPSLLGLYNEIAMLADAEVDDMLADDLLECALTDTRLFSYIQPFIYAKFKESSNNLKLLRVTCKFSDAMDILTFLSEIAKENLTIFKKDSFTNLVLATVDWETTEQWVFWQLVHGQGVTLDWCTQLIPRIDLSRHSVLAANVLLIFKRLESGFERKEPTMVLLRAMFTRPCDPDDALVVDMLKILIIDEDICIKVCELINNIFKKQLQNGDYLLPLGKQKIGQKLTAKLPMEQVISHLQNFSHHCLYKESRQVENFLSRQELREAFSLIAKSKEREAMKLREKYSDIFTTVSELRGEAPQRNLRNARKTGAQKRDRSAVGQADADEVVPPRPKQKPRTIESSDEDE